LPEVLTRLDADSAMVLKKRRSMYVFVGLSQLLST